jgi:uncharacterized protein (DUF2062 family)
MFNSHFLGVPRVAFVDRFDYIYRIITYGQSHFLATAAGAATGAAAGAAPGFGVVHATQSFLSGPLVMSQTEQIQAPALGLNRSIREGC